MTDQEILNTALMSIPSRSEKNEQTVLINTFVEVGTLFKRLSSIDNQIIYGRRGTGKTHTLQYLASARNNIDNLAVYADLNALGSAASVYSDATLTIPNRATTLLRDLLISVHEELRRAISRESERLSLHECSQWLTELLDQINQVQVVGETETNEQLDQRAKFAAKDSASVDLTPSSAKLTASAENSSETEDKHLTAVRQKGVARYHIKFGGVNSAFRSLAQTLPVKRIPD